MIRLLFLILGFSAVVGGVVYLALAWWSAPHRRLLRQYDRMREMILAEVDDADRPRAEALLDDCRAHLRSLIRTRRRLDTLDDMADAAAEFAELERAGSRRELEEELRDDVAYFVDEMGRISAEVDHDWRESMRRLEDFTDDLQQQREAFAELEELTDH